MLELRNQQKKELFDQDKHIEELKEQLSDQFHVESE